MCTTKVSAISFLHLIAKCSCHVVWNGFSDFNPKTFETSWHLDTCITFDSDFITIFWILISDGHCIKLYANTFLLTSTKCQVSSTHSVLTTIQTNNKKVHFYTLVNQALQFAPQVIEMFCQYKPYMYLIYWKVCNIKRN